MTAMNKEWRVETIKEINKRGGWKCAGRVEFFTDRRCMEKAQ